MADQPQNINIDIGRHSLAHVLAKAVTELFNDVKLAIGPPIDTGFYYDFDLPTVISDADFENIENKMTEILKRKESFVRRELSAENALSIFSGQPYKEEMIKELQGKEDISIYYLGDDFVDLCKGPHIDNTAVLLGWGFKVSAVAGAYWQGDENNPMLQRIYVYAYPSRAELKEYINFVEEAKKRDHRKLGPQLDLFFMDDTAPGCRIGCPAVGKCLTSF